MKINFKIVVAVALVVLLNICITYGLIYYFVLSKNLLVETGETVNGNLALAEGKITLREKSVVNGNVELKNGEINIAQGVQVKGNVRIEKGNLFIDDNVKIIGAVMVNNGQIHVGAGTEIVGDLSLNEGVLEKHSTAQIKGQKPDIFVTYDWPQALKYFDILPEDHKKALGYILLTNGNNTLIRDPEIKNATDYFAGIYFYQDGQLHSIDLNNKELTRPFFDKAKDFFTKLPERMLGTHGVGATTIRFSINPKKADVYIPSDGSSSVFIHEMGHVQDFQENFSDFKIPRYPFLKKELAVSSYGATHPGEDFAEAYLYYIMSHHYFSELIAESPEIQQKYDYLKKYVFAGKEFNS